MSKTNGRARPKHATIDISVAKMEVASENVRKMPPTEQEERELEASIDAQNLIENLVVRPGEKKGHYLVVAGGRRLRALKRLIDKGRLPRNHVVACQVRETEGSMREISVAENLHAPMHPADQIQSFADMHREGQNAEQIAERFGLGLHTVRQRLRLGSCADELVTAYREGNLTLEALEGFAMTPSTERQLEVWERLKESPYMLSRHSIRRELSEGAMPAGSKIAQFITVDAYEKRGGTVERDLFAGPYDANSYLLDRGLAMKIAVEKLEAEAADGGYAERWKWVDVIPDIGFDELSTMGKLAEPEAEYTDEEKTRIQTIGVELDALPDDEAAMDEKTKKHADSLEAEIESIQRSAENRGEYPDSVCQHAGVVLSVSHDATLLVRRGLVRPEDMNAVREAIDATNGQGAETQGAQETHAGQGESDEGRSTSVLSGPRESYQPPAPPERVAREHMAMSQSAIDAIREERTAVLRAKLGENPRLARDLLLLVILRALTRNGFGQAQSALAIEVSHGLRRTDDDERRNEHGVLKPAWWDPKAGECEAFDTLLARPAKERDALLGRCVAAMLIGQTAFEPTAHGSIERCVELLKINYAAEIRPTAEGFWNRRTKGDMIAIAREVLGDEWADTRENDKKGEIGTAMGRAFGVEDHPDNAAIPAGRRQQATEWCIPGLASFDHQGVKGAPRDPKVEKEIDLDKPEERGQGTAGQHAHGNESKENAGDNGAAKEQAEKAGEAPDELPGFMTAGDDSKTTAETAH